MAGPFIPAGPPDSLRAGTPRSVNSLSSNSPAKPAKRASISCGSRTASSTWRIEGPVGTRVGSSSMSVSSSARLRPASLRSPLLRSPLRRFGRITRPLLFVTRWESFPIKRAPSRRAPISGLATVWQDINLTVRRKSRKIVGKFSEGCGAGQLSVVAGPLLLVFSASDGDNSGQFQGGDNGEQGRNGSAAVRQPTPLR
jgi:hypothetical protein